MSTPAGVDALRPDTRGRWLVSTRSSRHIWDLDRRTYQRLPGSTARPFDHDGIENPITRVDKYPEIGSCFIVWFDDPRNSLLEHWRISSTIRSITRLAPAGEPPETL